MFYQTSNLVSKEDNAITDHERIAQALLDRLAPNEGEPGSERIWRFSRRMADVYLQQMERFEEDEEARQWRKLYSADNMPSPSETHGKAGVAAMMAFYSPTNFCKFQKVAAQQLLEWHFRQAQINPYPFGSPTITLVDIGAGLGIASLAVIDLLATWADVLADFGYKQLGLSVRVVSVEPDINKQSPRQEMFTAMSSLLDKHSIRLEHLTEIMLPYPESDCIQQILDAVSGGSLVICCMSNFLSSLSPDNQQLTHVTAKKGSHADAYDETTFGNLSPELAEKSVQCAEASRYLLANFPPQNRLLLASELQEKGAMVWLFADTIHPSLGLLARSNRVRFYSPPGSYWYSLKNGQSEKPDWADNFRSLAYWVIGNTNHVR